jgi:hypothetical protein
MIRMLHLFSAGLLVFCASIGTSVHAATPTDESQCVTPEPSILHWWPGDGTPVDFASGIFATNKGGLAYGNAVVQSGFAFDGADDYLELGLNSIPVPWTAMMWINRKDSVDLHGAVLLSSSVSALKAEQVNSSGRKVGITRYGVADWSFNYSLPRDQWTHLCFVANPGSTRLYVNGALEDTLLQTIPLPLSELGLRLSPLGPGSFKGIVDELMVFNDALTVDEINQVYSARARGACKSVHLIVRSSAADADFSFSVIAPGADTITAYQSADLKTWSKFLSTSSATGVLEFTVSARRAKENNPPIHRSVVRNRNSVPKGRLNRVVRFMAVISDSGD